MSDLSKTPDTVLVIAEDDGSADAIVDVLATELTDAVDTVHTVDDAVSALGPATDVGCVLVVSSDVTDVEATCRACRDADADVPIVAVLESFDETDHAAVTAVGDVRVIVDDAPASVAELVEDALDTYERRSRRRDDASMFRSFLSEIGVAMYVKDRKGRHVRVANVPGARSPQEMLGKRDTEIYPDSAAAEQTLADDLRVVEEATTIYGREERFETDTGPQWLRTNKAPWRDEGQVRGVVGLTWDITDELVNQRRLAEREETFETFAKSLSHDVRTPLQVARGNLELLREEVDGEEPADRADDALDRITEMMQDLEEVAKAEGRETIETEPDDVDVSLVDPPSITELTERVWSIIDTADATLDVEFGPEASIVADEASLRPLIENLFTNAVRHGGDDVSVTVGSIETGGFYVEDDGPGIPESQRQKVIEEGYTTVEDGSGTGFSIVMGVVNRRDWDLEIAESADGGARVEIHNCLAVADPPPEPSATERVRLGQSDDVGDVGVEGTADYDGQRNRWILEGAGTNIWQQENEFQFLHVPIHGPARIEGRVTEFDHNSQYSKAGFVIRDDLEEDAAYGSVGVTPSGGTEVLWRNHRGEDGVSQQLEGVTPGQPWYRVDRRGETVTTYVSSDGEDWTALDQRRVETTDPIEVGLAVCSHMPQTLASATFEDVTVHRLTTD